MAINIIFGRGGSGKSAFQMHVVVEELRHSRRNIVTNLTIDVPKLAAYLENKYPDEKLHVGERIRILNADESKEFWKYRGMLKWDTREGFEYEYVEDHGIYGVCYIIDEAGAVGFSASAWAQKEGQTTRGAACLWYLDQQRKFNDNVYASTNGVRPGGIAKGFRDKAHNFIKLKNGYLTTYGMFKARGQFSWYKFSAEPTDKSVEPIAEGKFEMDPDGLMGCYRTEDGVGITGHTADKGAKAKGIPIMMIFPMMIVLGLVLAAIPWALGRGAQHLLAPAKAAPKVAAFAGHDRRVVLSNDVAAVGQLDEVLVEGVVYQSTGPLVMLTDGTTATYLEGVQKVDRQGVVISGHRYLYSKPRYAPVDRTAYEPGRVGQAQKKPVEAGS